MSKENRMSVARPQPYLNFNFLVEIDGLAVAAFSEVTLPDLAIDVVEYRNGSDKVNSVRRLPGLTKFGNLVLKRGIVGDLALFNWIRGVAQGQADRRNIAVVLLDEQRNPVQRWLVRDAWPAKYVGATLNAKGNEVAIEQLELACEGIEIE
jgi:phage tail-like protein